MVEAILMQKLKFVLLAVLIFSLYFLPSFIFKTDIPFYNTLPKPAYAPSAKMFGIVWPILYGIFSIYITIKLLQKNLSKEMSLYFIINYLVGFFFGKAFFSDHHLFLSFTISFSCFITGLFLFLTTFKKSKKEFLYFLPYLIWTGFATVLMAQIYLLN